MTDISSTDRQDIQRAAAEALVGDSQAAAAGPEIAIGDIKDFFCQNWPMVKQVLQFLGDQIGGVVKWAVKALVAGGDLLHGKICK